MHFKTVTLINEEFKMVPHQRFIQGQFDGIYYERFSNRLFVMQRGYDYLQEVTSSVDGQFWLTDVLSSAGLTNKSLLRNSKVKASNSFSLLPSGESWDKIKADPWKLVNSNPLTLLKESLYNKAFNYRKHTFAFDHENRLLYVLQSYWKGLNGFEDKIVFQKVLVYSLEGMNFECWGELKVDKILQDTSKNKTIAKLATMALREAKQNKIVGMSVGFGEPWSLSIMYDNGLQIRLNILISSDKKTFSCLLQEFIGRTVDTEAKTTDAFAMQAPSADQATGITPIGKTVTKTYVGLPTIQAIVHKQASDNLLTISIENKLSKVPAAKRFDPRTCHIYPVEKAHTNTLSTIVRVASLDSARD